MSTETILITGGTGTIGRELVANLNNNPNVRVRVLTRNPTAEVPAGVAIYIGDLTNPGDVEQAMIGCDRVFLLATGTDLAQHDAVAVGAAVSAGVRRVVKLSALGVGRGGTDPITRWHRAGEGALQASGLAWTMLRPTGFMSNALDWAWPIAATGIVTAPYPDGRTAIIDPVDVARVAETALTGSAHDGQVYELTGPEPLTPGEQIRILAQTLGRPIEYRVEASDSTRRRMEHYGMAPDLANAVVALLASAEESWNAEPLPTVEQVTGRRPRTFGDWAARHSAEFASTADASQW